jgi:hypothetical protein
VDTYGSIIAAWREGASSLNINGGSSANARSHFIIQLLRAQVIPELQKEIETAILLVQFDDFAHHNVMSVAFGKKKHDAPLVSLIPDAFFIESEGYRTLREFARNGILPTWGERAPVAFWRGSATTNYVRADGFPVTRLTEIPRVALCAMLKDLPYADVGVISAWDFRFDPVKATEWFAEQGILKAKVEPRHQARYKFLIDIDGVANAWGFFEKLLLGSCVLKVETDYTQWFYGALERWRHYVPVKRDLSDLVDKLYWCLENDSAAQVIAVEAQKFALGYDLTAAMKHLMDACKNSCIAFGAM